MFVPQGYTEETVLQVMQTVLNQLCRAFRFGYYDMEDMRQEGYIYGMEALPQYKENRSSLSTFLHNHIRNRFINMQRNKLERRTPPCLVCPFYNDIHCNTFTNTDKCKRWRGWFKRNQSKRSLMETSIYDDEKSFSVIDLLDNLVAKEALDILDRNMPLDLRADYRRLIDGAAVPKARRDKVYEVARNILLEKEDTEEENGESEA